MSAWMGPVPSNAETEGQQGEPSQQWRSLESQEVFFAC